MDRFNVLKARDKREVMKLSLKKYLWKITRGYTETDFEEYWEYRCEVCGKTGLSCDLDGGTPIADTGDFNECYCAKCGCTNVENLTFSWRRVLGWLWVKISLYVYRKNRRETIELDKLIKEAERWFQK